MPRIFRCLIDFLINLTIKNVNFLTFLHLHKNSDIETETRDQDMRMCYDSLAIFHHSIGMYNPYDMS